MRTIGFVENAAWKSINSQNWGGGKTNCGRKKIRSGEKLLNTGKSKSHRNRWQTKAERSRKGGSVSGGFMTSSGNPQRKRDHRKHRRSPYGNKGKIEKRLEKMKENVGLWGTERPVTALISRKGDPARLRKDRKKGGRTSNS